LVDLRQTNLENTMKLDKIKKQVKQQAADTREIRARMRLLKQQSRQARQLGTLASFGEAEATMRTAVSWEWHANQGRADRRHLHLAYCYLKGRTYRECEQKCREDNHPWKSRVAHFVSQYGVDGEQAQVLEWLQNGQERRVQPEEAVVVSEVQTSPLEQPVAAVGA